MEVDEEPPTRTAAVSKADSWPTKLNLGCGWDKRDGYLNVDLHDFHNPDLVADIRHLAMLPSGYFDEIVAQDVLEHLSRADAPPALAEWARLLRLGGELVVRVPNLIGLLRLMERAATVEEQVALVQCLFGTQAYNGDYHVNGYTELLLRDALREAGFAVASLQPFDEWLFDVVAVRADSPPPVELTWEAASGSPPPVSVVSRGERFAEIDAALALARSVEQPEPPSLDDTRLRVVKKLVLRVSRLVTSRQAEYNRSMRQAVEALAAALRSVSER